MIVHTKFARKTALTNLLLSANTYATMLVTKKAASLNIYSLLRPCDTKGEPMTNLPEISQELIRAAGGLL
jgi:hypothetical protein